MEMKSLILGLVFTLAIFALKSGAGLSYFISNQRRKSILAAAFFSHAAIYAFILGCSWLLMKQIVLPGYPSELMMLIRGSMTLHFLLAALLFGWGVILLSRREGVKQRSHGWLLLALPCPVCVLVLLSSSALLYTFFPTKTIYLPALYAGFIATSFGVALGMQLFMKNRQAERVLGGCMLFSACYFLLTILIAPQFSGIEAIYRLCSGRSLLPDNFLLVVTVAMVCMVFGFALQQRRESWR